ncbi:MAG: phosphodiesterase [Litoreibacter sp.]|nr:phosphodiesterase [Litoreibacter sp.]
MSLSPEFLNRPIAHRGLHDRGKGIAENSRAAFAAAIAAGYSIELDVQMSADHEPMVFHDYDLRRLTAQTGAVRLRRADELKNITLSDSDNQIEHLEDILSFINGAVPVLIELKDQDGGMGPQVGVLENAISKLLSEYRGPVAVMSFNPHSVAALASALPKVQRGLVTSPYRKGDWPLSDVVRDRLREIPDFEEVGASFISHEHVDLDRTRVRYLKSAGATVLCWTVRSHEDAIEALKTADNITFEGYLPP